MFVLNQRRPGGKISVTRRTEDWRQETRIPSNSFYMFCLLQSGGYEIWECLHMKENTDDWHYSQTGHDWVKISPLISEEEGLQMFSLSLVLGYRISVISSQEVLSLYCCDIEMCRSEFVPPPGPALSPLLSIENWQERLKYPELRYCLTNIYSSPTGRSSSQSSQCK